MNKIKIIVIAAFICLFFSQCGVRESSVSAQSMQSVMVDTTRLGIVILAGQSNIQGGDTATLSTPDLFKGAIQNAYIFFRPNKVKPIQVIQYGVNNNYINPKRFFGPECSLAYYMTSAGERIGIIKYAYASSKLVDHGYRAQGHWQIDADPAHGRKNYDTLMQNFVFPGFDSFVSKGYKPYILAFDWGQGEGDCQDSFAANRYQIQLPRLFDKFKDDMRSRDSLIDSMTFIITKTHPIPSFKYTNTVRQAQENVAATYLNCKIINGDLWPLTYDSVHWTRYSQGLQGKAIADILIEISH